MNSVFNKKKIVKTLNELFSNNDNLSVLCNKLSNDYEKVIDAINKIIKGFFCNYSLVFDKKSLIYIFYQLENIDIDLNYKKYVDETKHNKIKIPFFNISERNDIRFSIPLDKDIRISDLDGLMLPSLDKIKEICDKNKSIVNNMIENAKKDQEERKRKYDSYKTHRGFDEVGFSYSRRELITIDSSFCYYHDELTGDINRDFNFLYNQDRYVNMLSNLSPLRRSYEENVNEIKTASDISFFKKGKIYEIENGRHRVIYILKNKRIEQIPVMVTRRIEDREFNIILNDLVKNYNVNIYKNNLLNDEANILLNLNGVAYVIKNKDELFVFYNNLKNRISCDCFINIPFNSIDNDIIKYKNLIFNKYLEIGNEVLCGNFTDLFKYFDNINNSYYEAFLLLQKDYQDSLVYGWDLKEKYEKDMADLIRKNELLSQWQNNMGERYDFSKNKSR